MLALGGAFTLCCALFDWDWIMNQWSAQFFIRRIGRERARIFFGLIGVAILIVGVLVALGSGQVAE